MNTEDVTQDELVAQIAETFRKVDPGLGDAFALFARGRSLAEVQRYAVVFPFVVTPFTFLHKAVQAATDAVQVRVDGLHGVLPATQHMDLTAGAALISSAIALRLLDMLNARAMGPDISATVEAAASALYTFSATFKPDEDPLPSEV